MTRNRIAVAVAAMLLAGIGPAHAARVDYVLDAGVEYDDNVRLSAVDPIDQRILRAGLGFTASEDTSTIQTRVDGRIEYRDFEDDVYSDSVEGTLAGRLNWIMLPERLNFTVENSLGLEAIDRFDTDSPDNRQQVNVFSAGPTLHFGSAQTLRGQAQLRYIDTQAEVTDEFDSQRLALALRAIKELDASSNLSGNVQKQRVDYDNDLLSRDHDRLDAYLRYERNYAKFDLAVDAGYSQLDFKTGADRSNPLLRADLGWRPTDRSRFVVSAASEFSDAASDNLGQIGSDAQIPDSIETGDTTVTSSVYEINRLSLAYTFTGTRMSFSVEGRTEDLDYLDALQPDEEIRGGGVSFDYLLQPTLRLGTYADIDRTRYTQAAITDETRRIGVRLVKQWSRHWDTALSYSRYERKSPVFSSNIDQNLVYLSVSYRNR